MQVLKGRNVNDLLIRSVDTLETRGVGRDSRNGKVIKFKGPATLQYLRPWERVLFHPERDANPFFHLVESVWMLAGDNTVSPLTNYVGRMATFSDDGEYFHGAYGYRWRDHFERDQLDIIIGRLREKPDDRQSVLQIWDATVDLNAQTNDIPCNDMVFFAINENGELDMTVANRSNDLVWGALGANAVHFSYLQEYMAECIGVPMGGYWQVANNLHGYENTFSPLHKKLEEETDFFSRIFCPYQAGVVTHYPLNIQDKKAFDMQCQMFIDALRRNTLPVSLDMFDEPFFLEVMIPVEKAHAHIRSKDRKDPDRYIESIRELENCKAIDWALACKEWILRRAKSNNIEL